MPPLAAPEPTSTSASGAASRGSERSEPGASACAVCRAAAAAEGAAAIGGGGCGDGMGSEDREEAVEGSSARKLARRASSACRSRRRMRGPVKGAQQRLRKRIRPRVVVTMGTVHAASASWPVAAGKVMASAKETAPRMPANHITTCIRSEMRRCGGRPRLASAEMEKTLSARASSRMGTPSASRGRSQMLKVWMMPPWVWAGGASSAWRPLTT
mmetsp:Transcript_20616/g.68101  ORF Transcript_20616/g.68101 Transcript_20616/m.68101 type:complete len:214 (-) Transcript_20616:1129-1770(-)